MKSRNRRTKRNASNCTNRKFYKVSNIETRSTVNDLFVEEMTLNYHDARVTAQSYKAVGLVIKRRRRP